MVSAARNCIFLDRGEWLSVAKTVTSETVAEDETEIATEPRQSANKTETESETETTAERNQKLRQNK